MATASYGQAFQEARQRKSDYFLILSFSETEREFIVKADLFLSRTGGKIDSFQVFRTGNDPRTKTVSFSFRPWSRRNFPFRGELLKRHFDKGLVSLGSVDGIKQNDTLVIVASRKINLKFDSIEFVYKPEDILGSVKITAVDDLVSEGHRDERGGFSTG